MPNPNWPLMDEAVSFSTGPNTVPSQLGLWASMIERTEGTWTSTRGRQYELDQTQAGTAGATYRNTDGALDPSNTASPFYPQVTPFRAYRRRAQLPATVNLLTASQATAGAVADTASGTPLAAGTLPSFVTSAFAITTAIVSSVQKYVITVPTGVFAPEPLMSISGWSVLAGQQYSATVTVTQTGLSSPTPQSAVQFTWYDVNGNILSTSTGTPVTITGTVAITGTAVAPSNAAGATAQAVITNAPTVSSSGKIDLIGWQVQKGTPTSYVQPGSWYSLFTGYVSRWPQTWTDGGTYGTSQVQITDAFGYLSQRKLLSPGYMELLALNPTFLYPLDEDTNSTVYADLTGQAQSLVTFEYAGAADNQCVAGAELDGIPNPNTGAFFPEGIGGPVVELSNGTPIGSSTPIPATVLWNPDLSNIGPPVSSAWTRIIMFAAPKTTAASVPLMVIWTAVNQAGTSAYSLYLAAATGNLVIGVVDNGTSHLLTTGLNFADGGWHIIGISMSGDGKTLTAFQDEIASASSLTNATDMRINCNGGYESYGALSGTNGFQGLIAMAAELPYVITNAEWYQVASTIINGGGGGTAGGFAALEGADVTSWTRYQDILRWAQWPGPQSEDEFATGETINYGPAVELLASANSTGTDVVTALQTVVDTDNGSHIVTDSGTIAFHARRARYNKATAKVTFGESTAGGEIPYTTVSFGLDTSLLANDASVTSTSNSNYTVRTIDLTSVANYGDVALQRNANTLNLYEMNDAAQFLANHYATPLQRLETISISPATFTSGGSPSTAAWAALLNLHYGDPVIVNRRPPGVTALSFNGFVEQIGWTIDDAGSAVCQLQISPNVNLQFWEIAATTMTLKNSAALGATSCVINPLPDSATNAIQSSFPTGDSVEVGTFNAIIDWGLSTVEFVTITTPTANSPGYTSATLGIGTCDGNNTVGTGFQFAHPAGAVLQYVGDMFQIPPFNSFTDASQYNPYLSPANVLDGFCELGTTTIVGY